MCASKSVSRISALSEIEFEVQSFLIDRRARGLAETTIGYYECKLAYLRQYMSAEGLLRIDQLTAQHIRVLLLEYGRDHTPGGVAAVYRAIKAFLLWYEMEADLANWRNPIRRVPQPKVDVEPLEPVSVETIRALLATCKTRSLSDVRDRAILLALLDTGLRAREFTSLSYGDLDLTNGSALVRRGKGGKARVVFLGRRALRAYSAYLRRRGVVDECAPAFGTLDGDRLSYSGLREILRRRARRAGVAEPSLHSFRRAFALSCLRNGMDVYSLQRLMGHADLSVLRRYLAQTTEDLMASQVSSVATKRSGRGLSGGASVSIGVVGPFAIREGAEIACDFVRACVLQGLAAAAITDCQESGIPKPWSSTKLLHLGQSLQTSSQSTVPGVLWAGEPVQFEFEPLVDAMNIRIWGEPADCLYG